ncbi:prepilin-type N-terminal cleavage/methylation domain-containing protein [Actimicrobium sp. CCC2.4]|uniref:prepilin-type N-terminal cleavage/methylation domain-containing protein n=1 Tax=Actimicrobium sp. CCC2.4 TaxID=3048606 RepID=UPI002AC89C65|nr:prepilin-type N-terminal cleavage/methylation domain-containing protein [Actimicrobium sp. CCC2.4]MEB0134700.1 prepilin-type N-terminal cleavage/methylation domain-containing protein [Actimicrobium sp. CCC2.4]WPX30643.1 prepilin-type N-terminal cleavage/methylation domain-containing protein [Actimicrobium sp. CCC2.4]
MIRPVADKTTDRMVAGLMNTGHSRGFTLLELILVLVITGILSAVVGPRLMDNTSLSARGFADQVLASLRYAQKTAIAQHRTVCVDYAIDRIILTQTTLAVCPGDALASPDGKSDYAVVAPSGIEFSVLPGALRFDALGRPAPNIGHSIQVSGVADGITVEAETGYAH